MFGFSPDDLDDEGRTIRGVRQVKIVRGQLVFARPKTGKTRDVPLPDSVRARINAHQERFKPFAVTLPGETLDSKPTTVSLLVTREAEAAVVSNTFNAHVWKPAPRKAGVPPTRENGMRVLRHMYASVLLDAGESVKALSLYLGHAAPGFTPRVYTHLLPTSEDRARRAIDRGLDGTASPDGLATA
jgi:integrase